MTRYLTLADYLVICEEVLRRPAEEIAAESRLELAESALAAPAAGFGDVEVYPDLATKAAVLCVRLVKNHPLVDGNKRAGFVAMVEFLLRNGSVWTPPPGDTDGEASAQVILDVAAGPGDEDTIVRVAAWIGKRIGAQSA
ncbi:Fic family protein [bacterium]|nr:Fic family protein [bacterium]